VGIIARLDPRHWGGRRVLQFLTGLALVALALVTAVDVPAAAAESSRPVVVAASPVELAPAGAARLQATSAATDLTGSGLDGTRAGGAEAGIGQLGATDTTEATQVVGAPDAALESTAVTGTPATPPIGSTPASLGSRAPPLG
jgi:hypothetical protein